MNFPPIVIEDGQADAVCVKADTEQIQLLLKEGDTVKTDVRIPDTLRAPVTRGEIVGTVIYYVNGEILDLFPVYAAEDAPQIDYPWCVKCILERYFYSSIT